MLTWIFTLPVAGLVGAGTQPIARIDDGDVIVLVLAAAIAATAFAARRCETRCVVPSQSAALAADVSA